MLYSPTPLPTWEPGAHIDLVFGPDLVRQYSLCGNPADRYRYQVAILREPTSRGGSDYAHDELDEGSTVLVRGPRNHFPLDPSPNYQFIAGGIGITPILAMIGAAEAAGAEWQLLYGGRRRQSMAYLDELAAYGDRVVVAPEDTHGRLDLDAVLSAPRAGTLVYSCGPEPLLDAVEERCEVWPKGSLRLERFTAKEHDESGDIEFEVVFESSGITATVRSTRTRPLGDPS